MKNTILITLFLISSLSFETDWFDYFKADYFVSATTGNDSNDGTSPWKAWATIDKVNDMQASFEPGDRIAFKSGDTWTGTLLVGQSGIDKKPITYKSYGSGAKPVISGFTTITGWTNEGGGVYSKTLTVESNPDIVTINGVQYAMGRTPNSDRYNPQYSDYYHIDSFSGTTQITDSECNAATTNWAGAEMVVKPSNYCEWGKYPITNHTGTTLTFTNSNNNPNAAGFGYFIQNDLRTLDRFGEWYYGGGKFYMHFGAANPINYTVNVSTKNTLLNIDNKSFITIKNLKFEGANGNAVRTKTWAYSTNNTIDNCEFDFNVTGLHLNISYNSIVTNCNFKRSSRMAVYTHYEVDGAYFAHNTVDSTGLVIGSGLSYGTNFPHGTGVMITYAGLTYSSKKLIIEYNTVTNSGYAGINFSGDSAIVRRNYVDKFGLNKSDGGGIYYGAQGNFSNMTIDNNIVLKGIINDEADGLPAGAPHTGVHGIYIDHLSTEGFTVTNNTVAHTDGNGIVIHGSRNVVIENNTVYNCGQGIAFSEYLSDGTGAIRNIAMNNNIIATTNSTQSIIWARSATNDFSQYGTINNNYYVTPTNWRTPFSIEVNTWATSYKPIQDWRFYGHDINSFYSHNKIDSILFDFNNSKSEKNVNIVGTWMTADSIEYLANYTLLPQTSIVLFKDTTYTHPDTTFFYGNIIQESFEGTGYNNNNINGWVESVGDNTGNAVNEDATTVPKISGAGSQSLRTVASDSPTEATWNSRAFTDVDFTNQTGGVWVDFWYYLDSHELANNEVLSVCRLMESSANAAGTVHIRNVSGTLMVLGTYFSNGAIINITDANFLITLDKWYHFKVRYDLINNIYELLIDGTSVWNSALTGTKRSHINSVNFGSVMVAVDMNSIYDIINIDNSKFSSY